MPSDASDVHPDHDRLTPDNADDWTEEQIDEYRDLAEEELTEQQETNRRELAKEQRENLNALRAAVGDDDEPATTTVTFGDAELEVVRQLSGEIESHFDEISDELEKETPKIRTIKDTIIDAILLCIVDDGEPDADPVTFRDRDVWEEFYWQEGTPALMDAFNTIAEPALSRYERLGN